MTVVATSSDGVWSTLTDAYREAETDPTFAWIRPKNGHIARLDTQAMRAVLAGAPAEDSPAAAGDPVTVWLPLPVRGFERFRVWSSPVMTPELAAKLPEVRTYVGRGVDDPAATLRCDLTPQGFHAQVLTPRGAYWIDPRSRGPGTVYTSYSRKDLTPSAPEWECLTQGEPVPTGTPLDRAPVARHEYRMALSCTGEYTNFHSPGAVADEEKKILAQAAIVTTINRVNGVFETEIAVRMVLVDNTELVFTDPGTDPFTGDYPYVMLDENQALVDAVVGPANYDIGHVFSTGGGGVAVIGSACDEYFKAEGVTSLFEPVGDPFDIDYVAHEMGHQLNATHTFAGCGGNSGQYSFEPGSGSTIMAYAGICGPNDLAPHSDPFFHHESLDQIRRFVATVATCGGEAPLNNADPMVQDTYPRHTIPMGTPFALTAAGGVDPDGETITYSWEERDRMYGSVDLYEGDLGSNPLWRFRPPTLSPTRMFPRLESVLSGVNDPGEIYPARTRSLRFRCTVRDNHPGGGGFSTTFAGTLDTVIVDVSDLAGPFEVTSPNDGATRDGGSVLLVEWSVAGSDAPPVSCQSVDVLLSADNGQTFPYLLAAATPNDGREEVLLPDVGAQAARIMVRAADNMFFNISRPAFTLVAQTVNPPSSVVASSTSVCAGQQVDLTAVVGPGETADWYQDTCGDSLLATGTTLSVAPQSTTTFLARARRLSDDVFSSTCTGVTIAVAPLPVAPLLATVDRPKICPGEGGEILLAVQGGSGDSVRWFSGGCGGTPVGIGTQISLPVPQATTVFSARWENACGVTQCAGVTVLAGRPDIDFNNDGVEPDLQDFFDYVTVFAGGGCPSSQGCDSIDVNGDGVYPDLADTFVFIDLFSGECS